MMLEISRRAVVAGLGSAMLGAGMIGKAAALPPPLPSLEEIYGHGRLVRLPVVYPSSRRLRDIAPLEALIGPDGRLRASPLLREGLARFLLHHEPVDVVLRDDPDPDCQPGLDVAVILLFKEAGLMPADGYVGMPSDEPIRFRFWRGDGWRKAGWPHPSDPAGWVSAPVLPL